MVLRHRILSHMHILKRQHVLILWWNGQFLLALLLALRSKVRPHNRRRKKHSPALRRAGAFLCWRSGRLYPRLRGSSVGRLLRQLLRTSPNLVSGRGWSHVSFRWCKWGDKEACLLVSWILWCHRKKRGFHSLLTPPGDLDNRCFSGQGAVVFRSWDEASSILNPEEIWISRDSLFRHPALGLESYGRARFSLPCVCRWRGWSLSL